MSTDVSFTATKKSRPSMMSQVVVTKTPRGASLRAGPGVSMTSRTNVMSRGSMGPLPPGELAQIGRTSVQNVKDTRSNEKKNLNDLNSKLAGHLEQMKFVEGMNKQLKMQCDKLKALKMFDDTKIKELVSDELDEMRNTIKALNEKCAALQAENLKLKDKVDTSREDLQILRGQRDNLNEDKEKLCRINADLEADINKLRKEIEFADNRRRMTLEELNGTRDDVERLQCDLEIAQREQMDLTDKINALEEEYEFKIDCLTEENEELKKLIRQLQNMEPDYSKMWEGQFKESLMKLQQENDDRINKHLADVQRQYELKIQKMQSEIKRDEPDGISKAQTKTLKSEVGNLSSRLGGLENENDLLKKQLAKLQEEYRLQCEECEQEKDRLRLELESERSDKAEIQECLERLMLEKGTLDGELNTYRCLLDQMGFGDALAADGKFQSMGGAMVTDAMMGGGGGSGGGGMSMSMSGGRGGSASQSSNPKNVEPAKKHPADKTPKKKPEPATSESSARMVMTKRFTGDLIIDEVATDGSYINLKNKGSTEIDLSTCKVTRKSNRGDAVCTFKKGQKVKPYQNLKIFSERFEDEAGPNDIVVKDGKCKTWGTGTGQCEVVNEDPVTRTTKTLAKLDMQFS